MRYDQQMKQMNDVFLNADEFVGKANKQPWEEKKKTQKVRKNGEDWKMGWADVSKWRKPKDKEDENERTSLKTFGGQTKDVE